MRKSVGVLVFALACSSHKNPVIVIPDGPPDASPDAPPKNAVTLETFGTISFIAYRDGAGPWQTPTAGAMGTYTLNVTNDYQWVIVCASGGGFDAELQGATYKDGTRQFGFCFVSGPSTGSTVAVTGQMVQAGTVDMYDTATSTTGNWSFSLNVPPGTHDLVAFDATDIYAHRAQAISAATSLGTLDLSTSGTAMTAVPLTINNLGSDTLGTELDWFLGNDAAFLTGTSTTIETPPASLVMQNDFEFLDVIASSATTQRTGSTSFTGSETSFTLMPPVTGITYAPSGTTVAATWGTLPTHTALELNLFGGTPSAPKNQHVTVTTSWLTATGATSLAFDAMPPGYDAAWTIDVSGPYTRIFSVDDGSGSISYTSEIVEGVNGAALLQPPMRDQAARLQQRVARARQ